MLSFVKRHQIIFVAIVLCLFSLHLASSSNKGTGGEIIVRTTLTVLTRPIQGAILGVRGLVSGTWHDYVYLVGLKDENHRLQGTIDDLLEKNNALKEELTLF